MSSEKKQRGSRFAQAMTDALVETYGKNQVSKFLYANKSLTVLRLSNPNSNPCLCE